MPIASIHTLGCRLNQADSSLVANDLLNHGFTLVPWGQPADLLIINTCSVTGVASQKSRQIARAARKRCPHAFIAIIGCDATADLPFWQDTAFVDLILPNPKPDAFASLLPPVLTVQPKPILRIPMPLTDNFELDGTSLSIERTRINLKIQEGCNFHCSYCLVPTTRGEAHSRSYDDIIREISGMLKKSDLKEIVLTGVNISTYSSQGYNLPRLIESLLDLSDSYRIRLGSTEPGPDMMPELIDLMKKNKRLCRFLHLPIQYGEDSILKAMGRLHYDCKTFAEQAQYAVKTIPGLCLGTDIIVGFPGETPKTFGICKEFLEEMPFGIMHIFPFSPRQGTPAASMPGRPANLTVTHRCRQLLDLGRQKAEYFANQQVGQTLQVLVEKDSPTIEGWSDNYLRVSLSEPAPCKINSFISVKITGATEKRQLNGVLVP